MSSFTQPDVLGITELRDMVERGRAEAEAMARQVQEARDRVGALRAGAKEGASMPKLIRSGGAGADRQPWQSSMEADMQALFSFVAQKVDVAREPDVFEHQHAFPLGDRIVELGRMVQWPLEGCDLKFSVPSHLAGAVTRCLHEMKEGGGLDAASLRGWTTGWELLIGAPEPAVFLKHRSTHACILLASWPRVQQTNFRDLFSRSADHAAGQCAVGHAMRWSCGVSHDFVCSSCCLDGAGLRWVCSQCGSERCALCHQHDQTLAGDEAQNSDALGEVLVARGDNCVSTHRRIQSFS